MTILGLNISSFLIKGLGFIYGKNGKKDKIRYLAEIIH